MNKKQSVLDDIPGYQAWLAVARACQLCQRTLQAELEPLGLEVAHYDVLANVARDEGLSQQVLARRLLVAKSNVSALIAVLERAGLVHREKDRFDARVRLVFLTAEGRRVTTRAMKRHAALVTRMMGTLSAQDAEALRQMMGTIAAALDRQPAKAVQSEPVAGDV
jgi:MarR family transcriptional regulator, organic hydroperoxide resistance regulator